MLTNPARDLGDLAEQYKTDENLRVRVETHEKYTQDPRLEPAVDAVLNLDGSEDLLDVGAGPGEFVGRLRASGHRGRLVGADHSPGMVERARADHPSVEFVQADAQQLPFADETFDVITARHMLYHVPDIFRALGEMHRILRKGGRFLAVTNASVYMQEYRDAIREAAEQLDGEIAAVLRELIVAPISSAFSELNGAELIRRVFGEVHVQFVEAELVFTTVEPVIRYFDSARSLKRVDAQAWSGASSAMADVVSKILADGPWRVKKRAVLLSARRAR